MPPILSGGYFRVERKIASNAGWEFFRMRIIREKQIDWIRRGECKRCGICCQGDKISPQPGQENEYVQEFVKIIGSDCPHLEGDLAGRAGCAIYPNRYSECQVFPSRPEDLDLINGTCGFYFIKRGDESGKDGY